MNVGTEPGRDAGDLELSRRWRAQFNELPSDDVDARIRAAARAATERVPHPERSRGLRRWFRIAPLAAAASVTLLAVGLVRLIPREEYIAIPASRQESPAAPSDAADSAAQSPSPAASPAAAELKHAPDFVPDAPTVTVPLPVERAASPPDMPDRERPAVQSDAAPPVAGGLRGDSAFTRGPATTATTQPESRESVAKAAAEPLTPPTTAVLADAARRTGKDVAALRILEVTPVKWRDASLGCDETRSAVEDIAGVPGFLITVDADGEILRYHTDAGAQVRTCE